MPAGDRDRDDAANQRACADHRLERGERLCPLMERPSRMAAHGARAGLLGLQDSRAQRLDMNVKTMIQGLTAAMLIAAPLAMSGCIVGKFFGGAMQNMEYQKKIEVPAKYAGLENKSVAVLVDVDLTTQYEHPDVVGNIAGGVSLRIQRYVPGAKVLPTNAVINWKYRTPQWSALPYGELAE